MATTLNIFNGSTNPAIVTQSSIFSNASGIYLEYTGGGGFGYEIDAYLQVLLAPGQQRNIPWILERDNLTTVNVLAIPSNYLGFPMRVDIFASEAISIVMWAIIGDCSCAVALQDIDTKVNLLLANEIISTVTSIAGLLLSGGGIVTEILPALLPGAIRTAIKILNPSTQPVLVAYGRNASLIDYDAIISANSLFEETVNFTGRITGITQSGLPANLNITTFP